MQRELKQLHQLEKQRQLELENKQLEQQKIAALSKAEREARGRQQIEQESKLKLSAANTEIEKHKLIQQDHEQKINEMTVETDRLRKKIFIIKWQYKDENEWKSYEEDICNQLEQMNGGKLINFTSAANKQSYTIKKTGKETGQQINTATQKKRQVRRVSEEKQLYPVKYPPHWNIQIEPAHRGSIK